MTFETDKNSLANHRVRDATIQASIGTQFRTEKRKDFVWCSGPLAKRMTYDGSSSYYPGVSSEEPGVAAAAALQPKREVNEVSVRAAEAKIFLSPSILPAGQCCTENGERKKLIQKPQESHALAGSRDNRRYIGTSDKRSRQFQGLGVPVRWLS